MYACISQMTEEQELLKKRQYCFLFHITRVIQEVKKCQEGGRWPYMIRGNLQPLDKRQTSKFHYSEGGSEASPWIKWLEGVSG